ncbi:MAG: glycosyltransferase family 4 protein [Anaerolineaceae bacterium]|jgi:glycosyltransferase involved in cell wall biosynthesis
MAVAVCIIRQSIYPNDLLVRREAETLVQAGYETHVICLKRFPTDPIQLKEEVINGVYVHHLPLKRIKTSNVRYIFDYLTFALLAGFKVTWLHFKKHFKVVQVNNMPDLLVFSALVPKWLGAKVLFMVYEPTVELWEESRKTKAPKVINFVQQRALAFADASITVTEQLKETLVTRGASPSKIRVALNAPDETFLKAQRQLDLVERDSDGFRLICHGAIEDRYGQDTILDAVALLRDKIPGLSVHFLGQGTAVESMTRRIDQLGLTDFVQYMGYVPLSQLTSELQSADAGIVAQKSSSYSNLVHTGKMYDYIAFGKPVVATRLKAVCAYFDDSTLAYFESGNPESLAAAILDLYRNPQKGADYVKNAREKYAEYCWEKQKEIYLGTYTELIGRA